MRRVIIYYFQRKSNNNFCVNIKLGETFLKRSVFKGIGTALVTPFKNGRVDYHALSRLIEFQIKNCADAIVVCGTTGESPVLSMAEQEGIIKYAINVTAKRIPVIAGVGSNDYKKALLLSEYAMGEGADGLLAVTPYYNKATDEGIIKYYEGISNASEGKVIAYNVPSRTGYSLTPSIYEKLCNEGFICGIKEAKPDMAQAAKTIGLMEDKISVYSGNDNLLLPFLSLGGDGCISVASNIIPREMNKIYTLYVNGEKEESRKMFLDYLDFLDGLFSVVNPVPVKKCAELLGLCDGEIRLPLTEYQGDGMERLLIRYGII